MGKSWATMNLKGGVGKTTLTANLCRALCELYPLKILIVDTDPQCSLTLIFRTEKEVDDIPESKTFYNVLCVPTSSSMEQKIEHCAVNLPHKGIGRIDLLPSHVQVIQPMITAMMASVQPGQTAKFDDMVQSFESFISAAKKMYDLVVLDTNPSGNIATFLAIKHADNIISPVTSDRFSIRGIGAIITLT